MLWKPIVVALLAPGIHALLRFSCSQLVIERLDPLVNPGVAQSPHLHQVRSTSSQRSIILQLIMLDHRRQCLQHLDGSGHFTRRRGYMYNMHFFGRCESRPPRCAHYLIVPQTRATIGQQSYSSEHATEPSNASRSKGIADSSHRPAA
jgi:hypothetical protein